MPRLLSRKMDCFRMPSLKGTPLLQLALFSFHHKDAVPDTFRGSRQEVEAALNEDLTGPVLGVIDKQLLEDLDGWKPFATSVSGQALVKASHQITVHLGVFRQR